MCDDNCTLILASQSPRRSELLIRARLGDFEIVVPEADETIEACAHPDDAVKELAARKARAARLLCGADCVIVAADTVVYMDGEILGKPSDEQDARRMLRLLSGRTHEVYTGVCVVRDHEELLESRRTFVTFRELEDWEIDGYIASGEPMDKAGAYGIQERGAMFVTGIEGDFYSVMGLPMSALYGMLKAVGFISAPEAEILAERE